jgi:predicted TIM-barrel fold metal-dependent hydrolase
MTSPHRIDVHHHPAPPGYAALMKSRNQLLPAINSWTPGKTLEDMERGGVATAVLSVPNLDADPPNVLREWNEYMARLAADHPGRFGVFAALPEMDIDAGLREIEHAFDVLEADGVGMLTNSGDRWLGDPHYAPLFEELDRRRAVVFVHPAIPNCCKCAFAQLPLQQFHPFEFPADTTRAIARMLFTGAAARYANIRFIFSHGGGTMPFVHERLVRMTARSPEVAALVPKGIEYELRKFHYELAQASHAAALAAITRIIPTGQLMFGSDYPYRSCAEHAHALEQFGFNDADAAAICRGNALRLLPRLGR